jgi:hypothetical protein
MVLAVLAQSPGAADQPLPIDPNRSGPQAMIAEAGGVDISTPVRPADLDGLGYHPEDEGWVALDPVGKNVSANPLLRAFSGVGEPQGIRYHVMDRAGRSGPATGVVDVGAEAETPVYAPVTGVVTAIKPDPTMQEANIVEIKPSDDPNVRVIVSLVQDISGDLGPNTPVTAGTTELGSVADLASVLKPQLSSYTGGSGNHVSIRVLETG